MFNKKPKKKEDIVQDDVEKKLKEQEEKVEIAQYIADKSQRISKRTEVVAESLLRVLRWLSDTFDKILFNPRHGKLVAFAVALIVFVGFNTMNTNAAPLQDSRQIPRVPVSTVYNSEMYEISGVDETVRVIFIGNAGELTMMNTESSDIKVVLDLSGYTEGTHNVKYKVEGVSSRIQTIIEPASANVTIKTKDARKVAIGYDFINQDKLAPQLVLDEPELSVREVSVKASKETLDKVAFVKALVDVSGQSESFETEASIYAYDQNGVKLEQVDIIPKTVKVKVGLSSPHKTVPIRTIFDGEFPEGKAISSITQDAETIMIYAPQKVLDSIDEIVVPIPTSLLTSDKVKLQQNISLPSGVRHGAVSKVNFEITLGEASSKTFDQVYINYANNVNGYKASVQNKGDTSTSITVYGTAENLEQFSVDNIQAFIDLREIKPGEGQKLPVVIQDRSKDSAKFRIMPDKESIVIDVIE